MNRVMAANMSEGFVLVAGNPVPANASCGYLEVSPKLQVRYGLFPAQGNAVGTVCLLQGRGECMERNFETIWNLTERGFQVASMDWRGQGGSPAATGGLRHGHVSSFSLYLSDFTKFMTEVVLPDCRPPYIMLGNSMGGHIGLRIIARHNWFAAAVMVAPLVDIPSTRLPRWFKTVLVMAMTRLGLGRLKVPFHGYKLPTAEDFAKSPLTTDRTRFMRNMRLWQEAPQLSAIAPTVGWVHAALVSCRKLRSLNDTTPLRCPALLVLAGNDTVVANEAIQQFARYVPGAVTLSINGAKHDVLAEGDTFRDQFFAAFDAFVADSLK